VASDASGDVLTYSGSWGSATNVDGSRSVSSISCPTTTFCAAVDSSGYAVVYAPVVAPATVSQLNWDTNGSLALVLGDSNYYYIYGPTSAPVEEISLATSIPTYLTYSSSNSTWLTTNEDGDEIAFYGYDAFGNLAFGTPTSAFGYAGQYTDATSGFSDLRARLYDGQTGTFTTRDPAFASTDTAYTYAGEDPVNSGDPLGMDETTLGSEMAMYGNPGSNPDPDGGTDESENGTKQIGGETEKTAYGRAIHSEFDQRLQELSNENPRWQASLKSGPNRPDGFYDGDPLELKPGTPSGIKSGITQLNRYIRAFGASQGYLYTYDIDGNISLYRVLYPK
jgi:RHS repeat-associated protein